LGLAGSRVARTADRNTRITVDSDFAGFYRFLRTD